MFGRNRRWEGRQDAYEDVGQSDACLVVSGNEYGPGAVLWTMLARMARRYDHVTEDDRSRVVVGYVKTGDLAVFA